MTPSQIYAWEGLGLDVDLTGYTEERMPSEQKSAGADAKGQRAMTASLEGEAKSLSFAVRSRGAEAATNKFNVFAECEEV